MGSHTSPKKAIGGHTSNHLSLQSSRGAYGADGGVSDENFMEVITLKETSTITLLHMPGMVVAMVSLPFPPPPPSLLANLYCFGDASTRMLKRKVMWRKGMLDTSHSARMPQQSPGEEAILPTYKPPLSRHAY